MADLESTPLSHALSLASIDLNFRAKFFGAVADAVAKFEDQNGKIEDADPGTVSVPAYTIEDPVAKAIAFATVSGDVEMQTALNTIATELLPAGPGPDCPLSVSFPGGVNITWTTHP